MLQKTGAVIDVIITYCAQKSGANVGFPPRADPRRGYQASDFIHMVKI